MAEEEHIEIEQNIDYDPVNAFWLHYSRNTFKKSLAKADINMSTKAIVQDRQMKILIVKDRYSQFWDLPGGHIDEEEDPLEALKREIEEETKLEYPFEPEELFTRRMQLGRSMKTVFFYKIVLKEDTPSIQLSSEHVDYRWVSEGELGQYNLGAFESVLEGYFNGEISPDT